MTAIPRLNPPAHVLGTVNAVMGSAGVGRHQVREFEGPLSIKFMLRGSGTWRSEAGVHTVEEGYFLVLNDGQAYSLEIAGTQRRESFCPFFRRGFVEDIHRVLTTGAESLLDDPAPTLGPIRFRENLHRSDTRLAPRLLALHRLIYGGDDAAAVEDAFVVLGVALLSHASIDVAAQVARVPARRPATREECHRRLARALDYLHAHMHEPLTLDDLAARACLSPFHFHRQFSAVHGLTPHQYLSRVRLERAARLLRDGDLPVTQVALTVGFDSPASFSRRFARAHGISPARYRAGQLRKNGKVFSA